MTEPTTAATESAQRRPNLQQLKSIPLSRWTPRHDRFALAMARGMTLAKASAFAGFGGQRSNAHRLYSRPDMKARIAELQAEITNPGPRRAVRFSVTKGAAITLRLHDAAAVVAVLQLEPADAIALANDLFNAARRRRQRPLAT